MQFRRVLILGVLAAAVASTGVARAAVPASALSGRFAITAGACNGAPSGSYFRMILPTGTADGPFVSNGDSACGDKSYTPLTPGTDGGLIVGAYQTEPSPAFDGSGNSLSDRIIQPAKFVGVDFSASTNGTDPQTKAAVPPPSLSSADDGTLSGDLRSFAAAWNNQEFNQGAPKPDGSTPGLTAAPAGTLDSQSGAFTLEWRSEIVGGPFDKFTGVWHLEGTFTPDTTPTTAAAAPPSSESASTESRTEPTTNESGVLGTTSSATTVVSPTSTPASTSSGRAASPSTVRSPNVVVARSSGGSSGRGWVAVPAALAAIAVGGLALRFRSLSKRNGAP